MRWVLILLAAGLVGCAPLARRTNALAVGMGKDEVQQAMGTKPITTSANGEFEVQHYQVRTGLDLWPFYVAYQSGRVVSFGYPGEFIAPIPVVTNQPSAAKP